MSFRLTVFAVILLFNYVISLPVGTEEALVITSTEKEQENVDATEKKDLSPPILDYMHVLSNVSNRYAHTVVSTRYKNPEDVSQEATFSIILPETAFITGFLMHIKDKTYEAYVREKEEAKREYDAAVSQGFGAAHVAVNARDSNRFTVSVNIEPQSKVVFNLTYEELLVRKHGRYEMVVNLHPGQLVKDLSVDVNIHETQPLVNVTTPAIQTGNDLVEEKLKNEYAEIETLGDDNKEVKIHFAPTLDQQKEIAKTLKSQTEEIFAGQFIVEYDVERDSKGGEVLVSDGYFVHFFAPPELKPLPKYAVFVLDISGSMYGRRIEQLRNAMESILEQLNPDDYFNLIEFNGDVKVWNLENPAESTKLERYGYSFYYDQPEKEEEKKPFELLPAYPATKENLEVAKEIVKNMTADGGTNIYDALEVALNMTAVSVPAKEKGKVQPQPMIVFLTDGEPTVGKTSTNDILQMVSNTNADKSTTIFSLAFGSYTDKQLLKSLSLKNNGFMRQIYEAADAALQLQDFYRQIASPLLTNVEFTYPEGEAETITKHVFPTLFLGGEFVICGKMDEKSGKNIGVHATTLDGPIDFIPKIYLGPRKLGSLERLWAYMTIQQLLDKKDELENDQDKEEEKTEIKKKALDLALKYSFVTPVTSLVVVKPNETQKVDTEEASGTDHGFAPLYASPAFGGAAAGGFGGVALSSQLPGPPGFPGVPGAQAYRPLYSHKTQFISTTPVLHNIYPTMTIQESISVPVPEDAVYDTESDAIPASEQNEYNTLTWISGDQITVNGSIYVVGDNSTVVNSSECIVESLTGHCKVLSACPKSYSAITLFEKYEESYFCSLIGDNNVQYAGVCCVDDITEEKVKEENTAEEKHAEHKE